MRTISNNKDTYTNVLTEYDFYPPCDTRLHCSGIEDVNGGNSYDEYLMEFWELYEEELFDCGINTIN